MLILIVFIGKIDSDLDVENENLILENIWLAHPPWGII